MTINTNIPRAILNAELTIATKGNSGSPVLFVLALLLPVVALVLV